MQQTVILSVVVGAALCAQSVLAVITVQIGGATRLNSLSRQHERYNCYWDCDLVGCHIAQDNNECTYVCDKICRIRYNYTATGRSSANGGSSESLQPKSSAADVLSHKQPIELPATGSEPSVPIGENEISPDLFGAGTTSVRLHFKKFFRNAKARNFAIWERTCSPDASTGNLTEKQFNL